MTEKSSIAQLKKDLKLELGIMVASVLMFLLFLALIWNIIKHIGSDIHTKTSFLRGFSLPLALAVFVGEIGSNLYLIAAHSLIHAF